MAELYKELYRPQFHLTPPQGPMSDPNGMVYFEGEYHQFYQFTGRWGHAVSRDLLYWEHLPLALVGDELGDIWSGSAVVDWRDTTGFFGGKPGLVAIFTHYKDGLQSQSIAYSSDKGRSWTKYQGNPVIPNPGLKDFRDPKVLWHEETGRWIMVVSVNKEIYFYSSPDLKEWTFESRFGEGQGCQAAVWECPDLFRLPVDGDPLKAKWVLHVSIGDNEETDGSHAQYFIGDFDGHRFVSDAPDQEIRWTDYGQDFYAAVSYSDIPDHDGRRIWLGWLSNWQYPFSSPTNPWKGGMSIPRSLSLRTDGSGEPKLVQQPLEELKQLRKDVIALGPVQAADGVVKLDIFQAGLSYEIEAEIQWEQVREFGISLRSSKQEGTKLGYRPDSGELYLDRTRSGYTELINRFDAPAHFAKVLKAVRTTRSNPLKMRCFVDDSVVEWFVDDGETVFTSLIYPDPESKGIELFASGGSVTFTKLNIYPLRSVWRP
ncbi:glycoside hydrolase family 32 protein [Paenibacillus caui]|uniref:glycoside hydrolase family 32 protein n=1 Tax=Paenibacillus caui TaxID=2873927 RepID=UPI001CA7FA64|nr:glycoside hydrolase family 32 protein [Paenibacillus caui]